MRNQFSLIAFFLIIQLEISAQRWPGNIIYSVGGSTTINMKDTSGNTIKQWTGLTSQTGYSTHLMPGGIFWRSANYNGNLITGGGVTGKIQKYNWNGTLLWDFIYSSSTYVVHHDHCPLPNGNVLIISYDLHTQAEIAAIGGSSTSSVKFDKIVEIKPTGPTTGVVVWEWRFWDHLCQTSNASLPNYVSSAVNNPQLLSMSNVALTNDFIHANGIDYNEELDQIVLSSHFLHEWFIIDHSTTTAEAASHSGGISGKGGDFLYRWGKPSNYGATGATNFNVLHDAHWVKKGTPRAGSIVAIHNNPNFGPSYIDWAKPTLNGYLYNYTVGQTLPPLTYDKRLNTTGYTSNMGNSLQFPNGNTQVCLAFAGNNQFREFDSLGNQLWQFTSGNTAQIQRYSNCEIDTNSVRAYFDTFTYFRCANSPTALQIDAQHLKGVGTYTYQWSSYPTASSLGTAPSITVNPNSTTSYTVTITSGSCSATASVIVRVETPKANAGNDVTIALGNSIKLKATGGLTYLWSNGANTDTNTVSPTSLTSYMVTVTNKYGCTASDTVIVNVLPKIVITASATPSQFCKGDSSILNVSATGGNGTYTYQWSSVPVGLTSTSTSVKVTPIVTTTYKVVVSSGGLKDSVYIIDTVKALPNIDAGFNTTILNGTAVFLQATGGTSYVWSNGKTTDTMTVTPSVITTYYVTGTGNGCVNKDSVIVNVLPKFNVNATVSSNNICFGDSVQLNVNASGATGSYSYLWSSIPLGFSSTLKNPKAKPSLTTTSYRLITTSGSFKDTQNIAVTIFPYPTVDAGSNVAINYGQSTVLTATGGTTYVWNTGSTSDTTMVSPLFTKKYFVTGTSNGCSAKDSVTVTVNGAPIFMGSISTSKDTICEGDAVNLDINPAGGLGTYTYLWSDLSSTFSSTIKNPTDFPTTSRTYKVVVTSGTLKDSTTKTITVKPKPIANAGANSIITFGQSIQLKASGASTYIWSNGKNTDTNTVQPLATTKYTVYASSNGCLDTADVLITVDTPVVNALVTAVPDSICMGDSTLISVVATGGTNSFIYSWTSIPTGLTNSNSSFKSTPIVNTKYIVNITSGSKSTTKSIDVIVKPKPATPTISRVGNVLTSSASSGNKWYKDLNLISNAVNSNYTPTVNGNYSVQVTNNFGCKSDKSLIYNFAISSVESYTINQLNVYPNPSKGFINIEGDLIKNTKYACQILDIKGMEMLNIKNAQSIDMTSLSAGTYFLHITTEDNKVYIHKIELSK